VKFRGMQQTGRNAFYQRGLKERSMKKAMVAAVACCLSLAAGGVYAQDAMKKDAVKKDEMKK